MAEMIDLDAYPVHCDKQLYILDGEYYRLPAFQRELRSEDGSKRMWAVWPAIDLKTVPYRKFYELLEYEAFARHGKFLFFKKPHDGLKHVYGVTPEFWYRWKEEAAPPPAEFEHITAEVIELGDSVDEKLLEEIMRRTQFLDIRKMRILWAAMVQVSMEWLLRQRKPIHLGYATLFAVPYRCNWKSIMLAAFPKSFSAMNKSDEKAKIACDAMGLTTSFRSRELLEMTKLHTCQWKIELIPTKLWYRCVERIEALRMGHGKKAYATYISNSIVRMGKHIFTAYRNFSLRAAAPAATFSRVAEVDSQELVPNTPKGGLRPRAIPPSSVVICADTSADGRTPRLVSLIEREIAEVSRVPNVQSHTAELRAPRGYLELSEKSEK